MLFADEAYDLDLLLLHRSVQFLQRPFDGAAIVHEETRADRPERTRVAEDEMDILLRRFGDVDQVDATLAVTIPLGQQALIAFVRIGPGSMLKLVE